MTYDKQPLSWVEFLLVNCRCVSLHLITMFGGRNSDDTMINLTQTEFLVSEVEYLSLSLKS